MQELRIGGIGNPSCLECVRTRDPACCRWTYGSTPSQLPEAQQGANSAVRAGRTARTRGLTGSGEVEL